ncbi:LOW QUALITY PROTEIN: pentatricopeptide repeat-containing protein At2g22410, mitochondrial-like [Rhodamnia argentea]|uniref:LOW QUALITY PROTEIN: pentatricopeptide repeat-containing protein At2g22410, mitochondrial-like n=1 Tax=Rhodamnia argentea TaxID=178133 RepID=A0A8B8PFD1_9MYRT|nr:LOW QUALITY PROTEIN: pentatricopeptide repeat-containing protein At2g22410, mitochondrial-like [Rhodamnia argentea]
MRRCVFLCKRFSVSCRSLFPPFELSAAPQSRPFSSSCAQRTKWNSTISVIITNPVLLLLESCTSMRQLKQLQAHMTRTGLMAHTFPASRVLAFCALSDSGDVNYARSLFAQIENPNSYMWNTMIRGYSKAKTPSSGLIFFCRMISGRVEVDGRSFVFALKACERFEGVFAGKFVHCRIWKMGFDCDLLVRNGLIHFYTIFRCLDLARRVFDESPARDVFTWTSMIDGYAMHGCPNDALQLFDLMLSGDVKPNEVTMIAALSGCSQKKDLNVGRKLHELIRKENVACSLNLRNALIDMYIKCDCLVSAREVFDNMETRDVFSMTSMVNGYAKFGELENARILFDKMPEKNVVSWSAMIAGYSQNGQPKEALEVFANMREAGLVPVENTLVCVLSACGQLGRLEVGCWIHSEYILSKKILVSVILGNALIDMYAKCGCIDAATEVFVKMTEKDLVSWNSMITGFAAHGHAEEALELFHHLESTGFRPDKVTFLGVLSACSHAGLLREGQEYFKDMEREFGIAPQIEHYACMVDLYGRNGLLKEAYELITTMPMVPNEATWGALLSACRTYGNVNLGMAVAEKLLELNPEDSGIYSLMANIFARGKEWSNMRMVKSMMRERSVKKTPGHSLIEVEGKFHEFLAADGSYLQSEEICSILNHLSLLSSWEDSVSCATLG